MGRGQERCRSFHRAQGISHNRIIWLKMSVDVEKPWYRSTCWSKNIHQKLLKLSYLIYIHPVFRLWKRLKKKQQIAFCLVFLHWLVNSSRNVISFSLPSPLRRWIKSGVSVSLLFKVKNKHISCNRIIENRFGKLEYEHLESI